METSDLPFRVLVSLPRSETLKVITGKDDDLKVPSGSTRGARAEEGSSSPPDEGGRAANRGRTLRIVALVLALYGIACGTLVVAHAMSMGTVRAIPYEPLLLAIIAVAFALTIAVPVSFHYRGETTIFILGEVPLLIGLVFLPPWGLLLARVVGVAIGVGVLRRQPILKVLFNTATTMCGAGTAVLVYHAMLGHSLPVSPIGWVAGFAALAASAVVTQLAVHLVVRLNGDRVPRRSAFQARTFFLLFLATAGLALVVLDTAWREWWAVAPLLLVGGLIVVAFRNYARITDRFSALQRLYDFSGSLSSLSLEPSVVGWTVLREVQRIVRARRAQLFLVDETGLVTRQAVNLSEQNGRVTVRLKDDSVVARALASGEAALYAAPNSGSVWPGRADPALGAFRDAMVAPLKGADRLFGVIIAMDRDEEQDTFDADDLRLFEALAAQAVSTLQRARLMEELRAEADSRQYQATHDLLTKLPNRSLFLSRATAALETSGRAAVALLDIDRFKDVNDTLGHETGDRLLCEVSDRLVQAAYGRATVARLGGDEFALVVPGVIGPEEAIGLVRDLHAALARPIDIDGLPLAISASTGIALAPEHGDNVTALLQRADIAMYIAKDRRTEIEMYSVSQDQSMQRRLTLGGHLLHALEMREQLSVVYQPIADLGTGKVLRVEALSRWNHPDFGWVPATEFIGIAEQMGLIGQVTDFVLGQACAQAAEWRRLGLNLGLAVNLSGRELADDRLVALVSHHLELHQLPAHCLTLELTETEVMGDLAEANEVLGRLARLGVRIAVDDYGTGYSSLAYLHRLPVQELKIDRSFVTNIVDDPSNRIIVRSSIAMAHSLGLTVVAEGAEDEVTCAVLADAGCDAVQGYYFSRPKTPSDLEGWLLGGAQLSFHPAVPPLHPLRVLEGRETVSVTEAASDR